MKIYVVIGEFYSGGGLSTQEIMKMFSSKQKAEAYKFNESKKINDNKWPRLEWINIEEHILEE